MSDVPGGPPMGRGEVAVRLAAEFAVVFLGVLLALAADEWREVRQEREDEIGYLERLRDDLVADTVAYRIARDRNEARAEAVSDFLTVVRSATPLPDAHLAWLAAVAATLGAHFDRPHTDTYQELLNQGDRGRIRSGAVRAAMAAYYDAITREIVVQFPEWEATAKDVEDVMIQTVPSEAYRWLQAVNNIEGIPDPTARPDLAPPRAVVEAFLRRMRTDDAIANLLVRHGATQRRLVAFHEQWTDGAVELMATLDDELRRLRGG